LIGNIMTEFFLFTDKNRQLCAVEKPNRLPADTSATAGIIVGLWQDLDFSFPPA
jgi:hypothetical protein